LQEAFQINRQAPNRGETSDVIAGHAVPEFVQAEDALLAIEMTIVDRPYLLDFAGARLPHEVSEFEEHVIEEYSERLQGLLGDRGSDAMHVAAMFRRATGFTLMDVHPGNIAFAD